MVDVAFAAGSIPDAPDLDPSLGFAWERLRFFDPSSGSTTVWLLAGARGDVPITSRLSRIQMGREALRFVFKVDVQPPLGS